MKTLSEIQEEVDDLYIDKGGLEFNAMCLAGEAGEVCNWVKSLIRNESKGERVCKKILEELKNELPDVLFYVAKIANDNGWNLEELWEKKMIYNRKKYNIANRGGEKRLL